MDTTPIHGFVILTSLKGFDKATVEVAANITRIDMGLEPKSMNFIQQIPRVSLWKKLLVKGLLFLKSKK